MQGRCCRCAVQRVQGKGAASQTVMRVEATGQQLFACRERRSPPAFGLYSRLADGSMCLPDCYKVHDAIQALALYPQHDGQLLKMHLGVASVNDAAAVGPQLLPLLLLLLHILVAA